MVCLSLAGRHAGAARGGDRHGRLGARRRRGRHDLVRRGHQQPGRGPRGDELRRRPQAAGHLRVREQRLRHQRAARQAGGRRPVAARAAGYGFPGVMVDGGDPLACYAAAKEAHDRARARRGPDPDRGARGATDQPLLRRRPAPLPRPGRGRGAQGAGPDRRASPASCARRPAHRRAGRGAAGRDQGRRQRGQPKRAEARPDPDVATAELHVYADGDGQGPDWPS